MDARAPAPTCVLFDNGSLRPESVLNLRGIARQLEAALGVNVRPVSLLHSSAIAPSKLGGVPAHILEPALTAWLQAGVGELVLVPLFFGPSAALTEYVPRRLEHLRHRFPAMQVRLGRWLVDITKPDDTRIAGILADQVRSVVRRLNLARPDVVLVDHGSPQQAVIAVRDFLGGQLRRLLSTEIGRLAVASMERRRGPEYDFCEPLLAALLRRREFAGAEVMLVRQFFSPGRHAGPGGDIADICAAAEEAQSGLKTHLTDLIGGDARLIDVLADRYREVRNFAPV